MSAAFTVSAPASSANLGSGFDAVALALEVRMIATVEELPAGRTSAWTWGGAHPPTHDGLRGCIERGIVRIATVTPPLAIRVDNDIPLAAGLGSSAAAHALGVAIGARYVDRPLDDDLLATTVAELEGHPDNALAAWYGGAVIAVADDARVHALRVPVPPFAVTVVVPDMALATSEARALLPPSYERGDVIAAVGRAALLGAALASGRVDLLAAATSDVVHQRYRAAAIPGLDAILRLRVDGVHAFTLSGAGPSVLVIARDEAAARSGGHEAARVFAETGLRARLLAPFVAASGIVVSEGVVSTSANRES